MEKSDYEKASNLMREAVINVENALCCLDENHEDREKLNDLIDTMSNIMKLYELQAEQIKNKG